MTSALILDDEELARDYLQSMLQELSLPVAYEAASAADALNAVKNHRPDVAFLDIELPDHNGLDVLKQVKRMLPTCFVVMVSGHSTFENLKNAMDHGAAAFIVKPYSRKKLEHVMQLYRQQLAPFKSASGS